MEINCNSKLTLLNNPEKLRISGIASESIVDGVGLRFTIFTQGCHHDCPFCHNPTTHDLNGGKLYDIDYVLDKVLKNRLIKGVTFSGGEPFLQAAALSNLASKLIEHDYNIWTYTGFTFEEILKIGRSSNAFLSLLQKTDVLVDGKFENDKKDLTLKFRGSSNQRVIDVKKSLAQNKVVLYCEDQPASLFTTPV